MSTDKCGCSEYRGLSRRGFLRLSGSAAVAAAAPAWMPNVVYASSHSSQRDVLVSVFLRGGWDGLTAVVPHADDRYYSYRPRLAIRRPDAGGGRKAIDLDGFFGFAPAMKPLVRHFKDGNLLVVHACGSHAPTRSHFAAMHNMEVGSAKPKGSAYKGWLGRHLATTAPTDKDAALRAVGIGVGLQRTLVGGPLTLPITDLSNFGFEGPKAQAAAQEVALDRMYDIAPQELAESASNTMRTIELLASIDFARYRPSGGARYPADILGMSMQSVAALIKADVGVEAVAVDLDGWDTHVGQQPTQGIMAFLMQSLAGALDAFSTDLMSDGNDRFAVVAMSEFGRQVRENASAGTDHGHGTAMLALGGGIAGGRVLTEWPGLGPEDLYQGQDLAVTIDYRDIVGEILTQRLGNRKINKVFQDPTYERQTYGITR